MRTHLGEYELMLGDGRQPGDVPHFNGNNRTVVMRAPWYGVSLKDYATGDGSTDDTAGIAAAITAAKNSDGRTLFVPQGTFLFNTTRTLDLANLRVLGVHPTLSILKLANTSNTDGFNLTASGITFENIGLDGNKANNATVGSAVTGTGLSNCRFIRCHIYDWNRGIYLTGSGVHATLITHCRITGNKRYGVWGGTDSIIGQSWIGDNGSSADADASNIYCEGWDIRIAQCHLWGTSGGRRGVYGYYANDIQIVGCVIEEHEEEGIYINGRGNGWIIDSNYLEDNSNDSGANSNVYAAIRFVIDTAGGETGHRNVIVGNRFGMQDGSRAAYHKYCIQESAGCNFNHYANNQMINGYRTSRYVIVGTSNYVEDPPLTRVTSAVDVANTVTETDLISQSIEGYDLGVNRTLRVTLRGDCLYNNDAANTLTLRVKLGATTAIATAAFILQGGLSASRRAWTATLDLTNLGATNSQAARLTLLISRAGNAGTGTGNETTESSVWIGTAAEDTTAAKTLAFTAQWSAAAVANSWRMTSAVAEWV